MSTIKKIAFERDELKEKLKKLVGLLQEANETVSVAIGVELEYADYESVEKLKALKQKIEFEVKNYK